MTTFTEQAAQQLGARIWERGEHRRAYLPDALCLEAIGLFVSRSGSGAITHATLHGQKISNNKARQIGIPSAYIDLNTGELHANEQIVAAVKQRLAK